MEKLYQNKEYLYEQYIILGKSMSEIAKLCNCSVSTIRCWLIKFNIPIRTISESNKGKKRNPLTKEHKKHLSESHKGQISWNKGRILEPLSEKHRKKISEALKGKKRVPFSNEWKENISKGKKGQICSPETKQKLSKIMKQKYENGYINPMKGKEPWNKGKTGVYSPEALKQMSESRKGEKNHFYGKKRPEFSGKNHLFYGKGLSKETKQKISEARIKRKQELGYINSPETRQKISESQKGRIFSEEHKRKLSRIRKEMYKNGYIAPFKGKHHSPETLNKISEANKNKNVSSETRKLMSKTMKEFYSDKDENGKSINHPWYNPNRAEVYAPYGENFYDNQLRNKKWNLQNGRDLLTGDKLEYGFNSVFHHIDWNKSNDKIDNFCWITRINHRKVHSKQKRKYYETLLRNNLQTLKQGKIPESWKIKNKEIFKQEKLIQLELPIFI